MAPMSSLWCCLPISQSDMVTLAQLPRILTYTNLETALEMTHSACPAFLVRQSITNLKNRATPATSKLMKTVKVWTTRVASGRSLPAIARSWSLTPSWSTVHWYVFMLIAHTPDISLRHRRLLSLGLQVPPLGLCLQILPRMQIWPLLCVTPHGGVLATNIFVIYNHRYSIY
ncbi:hypothetical protein BDZ97DRAFT_128610 [Flammula alnicola]|nr:hypothetical protein BDZ97DRAFT_128610 [Flammula alnicola]